MDLIERLSKRDAFRESLRRQEASAHAAVQSLNAALGSATLDRAEPDAADARPVVALAAEAEAVAEGMQQTTAQLRALEVALQEARKNDWRMKLIGLAAVLAGLVVVGWLVWSAGVWVVGRVQDFFDGGGETEQAETMALPPGVRPVTTDAPLRVRVSSARVREAPSTDSTVVGALSRGADPVLLGETDGADGGLWYFVRTPDGLTGYVAGEVLEPAETAREAPPIASLPAAPQLPAASEDPNASLRQAPIDAEALARAAAASEPEAPAVTPYAGVYVGTYRCGQGVTGLRLTLTPAGGSMVDALFEFFPIPENPGVPSGSASFIGSFDPSARLLRLDGQYWIQRPPGYDLISLEGRFDAQFRQYSGQIASPACSTFVTVRQD